MPSKSQKKKRKNAKTFGGDGGDGDDLSKSADVPSSSKSKVVEENGDDWSKSTDVPSSSKSKVVEENGDDWSKSTDIPSGSKSEVVEENGGDLNKSTDVPSSSKIVEQNGGGDTKLIGKDNIPRRSIPKKDYARSVCIVVLGDIGHSPRMNYHAESFAKEGFLVTIIGYVGSGGIPSRIQANPSISTIPMREAPQVLQKVPRLLAYPLKMAWLSVMLTFAFLWMVFGRQFCPEFILVQNPPAIPSLALCWIYSKIFACDFIIDWHNYGFSLMSLVLSEKNPLVRFATWFENYFGKKADHHLCVTRAMKDDLHRRLGVSPITLYDRPPERFQTLSREEQREFLEVLCTEYYPDLKNKLIPNRKCGILVSGTSWTEDEDFGILLAALESYDRAKSVGTEKYPELLVFITGKGPMKEFYRKKIAQLNLQHVSIYLPWLKHEDYPKLLGCADLGISLHTSSSGLDLPMKVVDMYGCGLPVFAVHFNCISELVQNNVNGLIFKDSEQLATQIQEWFCEFSKKPNKNHEKFREELKSFQKLRWHENWMQSVMPLLK